MPAAEVRRLAGAGVAALGLRQIAIRVIGLIGTVVLARLLLPRDFGAIAVGTTVMTVLGSVGDAGIGAGLIRGRNVPTREDLQAFLGFQLAISLILLLVTAAVALPFGLVGRVTALIVASLPVAAFRSPTVILLERDLRYRPLVVIELLETLIYNVWAIGTVLAGWGVWGLASGVLVRTLFGAVVLTARSPAGVLLPRLSWTRVRSLVRFGLQYQAVNAVVLVRSQGLNVGIAAIAGIATLGLWSLSYRILQVPFLLFDSVWRVSFPAMARLVEAGEEVRPIMERGLAIAAVVSGGLLSVMVGSAPALVPSVFGAQWAAAGEAIPWAAAGLMLGGPVAVATTGYLFAVGDSSSVLLNVVLQTLAWFLIAFALLPRLGVQAIGIGWMAAGLVEAVVLSARTRRHTPIHVARNIAVPALLATMAATIGWFGASSLRPTLLSTVAGGTLAGSAYLLGLMLVRRQLLGDTIRLALRSLVGLGR